MQLQVCGGKTFAGVVNGKCLAFLRPFVFWRRRDAFRTFQLKKIKIVPDAIVQSGLTKDGYKGRDVYV